MKKETKKLIETIVSYVVAAIFIIAIPFMSVATIKKVTTANEELLYDLYEARTKAETYEAINEMLIDLLDEKKQQLSELLTFNRIYIKTEDDGDFELYWYGQNGWEYVQVLGGEEVERQAYGHIDEQFIINLLGARISEFRKI